MKNCIWNVPKAVSLSEVQSVNINKHVKELLVRRGYSSVSTIQEFVNPTLTASPSEHFPQLIKASKRVINAITNNEEIAICGDYDADGMTSTALLVDVFTKLKGKPRAFIPSRTQDGYGLNKSIVADIYSEGIKLIITVDNGVSAIDALSHANSLGLDVIITDHHQINGKLPNHFALIHPQETPIDSPFRTLAGVGLSYVLAECIAKVLDHTETLDISRDLLCIGTIADMSKLYGANRFWLKKWIKQLSNTKCKGLKELMNKANLKYNEITSEDISFKIAPRINSIGRIDDPKIILDLILEDTAEKILPLVRNIEEINKQRKYICSTVEREALNILEKDNKKIRSFILLAQNHWNAGVIGIVASRIMEKYSRPAAILTSDKPGVFRASVRSIKGINVIEVLNQCSDLLEKFGGHAAAAGFTVKAENLMRLEEKLVDITDKATHKNSTILTINPESYLKFSDINKNFVDDLRLLEPFGVGNNTPVFWSRRCIVRSFKKGYFGELSMELLQEDKVFKATQYNPPSITKGMPNEIDIAFTIDIKTKKSKEIISLKIIDYREYSNNIRFSLGNRIYLCYEEAKGTICFENQEKKVLRFNVANRKSYFNSIKGQGDYIENLINTGMSVLGIVI